MLRDSLVSLEAQEIRAGALPSIDALEWSTVTPPGGQGEVPVPSGWVMEPGEPVSCADLPRPDAVVAAFAPRDFTMAVRVAVWADGSVAPESAALTC